MSDFLWSLKNGELDQVKEYVEEKGVDINATIDGRRPIHYAADYGQTDVVKYLIEKGANVNYLVSDTSCHLLTERRIFEEMSTASRMSQRCLCMNGLNFLARLRDFNAKDKHGISALLAAIWEGHTSCVKLLLEKGALKDGVAPDGTSYIDAADKQEIKDMLK